MLLLDTHVWLWWVNATPGKLSNQLVERIENEETVAVSAISCFEIEWLARHGRIELNISLNDWFGNALSGAEITCLPITGEIARLAAALPEHHKDPQDRMIIATAMTHQADLLSADAQFALYDEIRQSLLSP